MEELQDITGEGFQDSLHLALWWESILKVFSNLNGSVIIFYI